MKVITCPRCYAEFTRGLGVCPECGVKLLHSISGVVKTSAVLISSGSGHGFYRSVEDVPQPLRARLIEVTTGDNAGTIVIADRAGKEQITQSMNQQGSTEQPSVPARYPWILWAAAFLILMAIAVISAAFMAR